MKGDSAMGSTVSGLADAVLGVVQGVGLSSDTVARYGKCCEAVVEFCGRRGLDALSGSVVEEFVACQQERARRGEIGPDRRNALVKSARMMLEFQRTGRVTWRMMSPDSGPSESSREVLEQFAAAAGQGPPRGPARGGLWDRYGCSPGRSASSWPTSTGPAGTLSARSPWTTSGG